MPTQALLRWFAWAWRPFSAPVISVCSSLAGGDAQCRGRGIEPSGFPVCVRHPVVGRVQLVARQSALPQRGGDHGQVWDSFYELGTIEPGSLGTGDDVQGAVRCRVRLPWA